jgi:hypothetical protein
VHYGLIKRNARVFTYQQPTGVKNVAKGAWFEAAREDKRVMVVEQGETSEHGEGGCCRCLG